MSEPVVYQLLPKPADKISPPWRIVRKYYDKDGAKCMETYAEFWSENAERNARRLFRLLQASEDRFASITTRPEDDNE
jgi:hypothetical protein